MIMTNSTTDDLRNRAAAGGMVTLREYGLKYVLEGITTADEVVRETVLDG
jgi:type IV pilus assembly protein PilB